MVESDSTRRLACFDRESARLAQESPPVARNADSPATAAPAAAAPAQAGEDRFGYRGTIARAELDKKEAEERRAFEQLTAKVTEVGRLPHGEVVLTLDNGQVWQQKPGDRAMRIKAGDEVTIHRASLGSFLLTSEAAKGSMRVARVK
jgi:hypothetical protein